MSQLDEINQALRQGGKVTFSGSTVSVRGIPNEEPAEPVADATRLSAHGAPMPSGSGDGGAPMPPDLGTLLRQAARRR
jgi:hypothetical protein